MDLSLLEDFKVRARDDWADWDFQHEAYEDIPLSFFDRFARGARYCDLSVVPPRKEDTQFMTVEGNTKIINRDYISRNIKMVDRRKMAQTNIRIFTKKQKRNNRPWHMQYKTKFKEITAKSDWIVTKTFHKRDFSEDLPKVKHFSVETLKVVGSLYGLDERVEKIAWSPVGIRQNEQYKLTPVSTCKNPLLYAKVQELMGEEKLPRRSVVLSLEFLLAVVTARGGQYPWNILIEKDKDVVVFQNYLNHAENGDDDLSYLDLFTTNENTTNNMPVEEARVKENSIAATKYTHIFKDLLASGELLRQEPQDQEDTTQRTYLEKLVRLQIDDIDFYTTVKVDGGKVRDGIEECLIRAFMETGTDASWIEEIKTSQSLIFTQYLANSCSLQKWVCEAVLAGVKLIKLGFIGITRQKPMLINVHETTPATLQTSISFKNSECWAIIKRVVEEIYKNDDGQYILSRASYTPLSIKLFRLPQPNDDDQDQS